MHQELEKYLVEKYPKIFSQYYDSPKQTCMCWGCSCGNGWFHLIDVLCASIQSHVDNPPYVFKKTFLTYVVRRWYWIVRKLHLPSKFACFSFSLTEPEIIPQVVATQVKEKFGGLRFYYNGGNKTISGMVALAEDMSYRVCEICGVVNEMVGRNQHGWIRTTCPCCATPEIKAELLANRDSKLISIWELVFQDMGNPLSEEEKVKSSLTKLKEIESRNDNGNK